MVEPQSYLSPKDIQLLVANGHSVIIMVIAQIKADAISPSK
jgi:hypothetical protein